MLRISPSISIIRSSESWAIFHISNPNRVFCKPEERLWICIQCDNIMSRECAPEICSVCGFLQGFYKLYETNKYA